MTEQHWHVFCLRLPVSCPSPGRVVVALLPWHGEAVLAEAVVYVGASGLTAASDFKVPAPGCRLLATGSCGCFQPIRHPEASLSRGCCSGWSFPRFSVVSSGADETGPVPLPPFRAMLSLGREGACSGVGALPDGVSGTSP